uniref:Uncharacterized protein n=1 Tax=Cacopsylla melanoneura TaxID=428564 RepID=A0A8D9E5U3_9HEMI
MGMSHITHNGFYSKTSGISQLENVTASLLYSLSLSLSHSLTLSPSLVFCLFLSIPLLYSTTSLIIPSLFSVSLPSTLSTSLPIFILLIFLPQSPLIPLPPLIFLMLSLSFLFSLPASFIDMHPSQVCMHL